jgi:hypothetical protein
MLVVSSDNGASWSLVKETPGINLFRGGDGLAIGPFGFPIYLAGPDAVYVMMSPGADWVKTLQKTTVAVAVDPRQPNVVYAGGSGMWKSSDFGMTWATLRNAPSGTVYGINVDSRGTMYVALHTRGQAGGGVWRSRDGGSTWRNMGAKDGLEVNTVAFDRETGFLYAGTEGLGVGMYPEPTAPVLSVTPSSLEFHAMVGGRRPQPKEIVITNAGVGTMRWTATATADWINVRQVAGSLAPDASYEVPVELDVSDLQPGTHRGLIRIAAPGSPGSAFLVRVIATVRGTTPLPSPPPKR